MSFFEFNEASAKTADAKGSIETGVYKATIDTVSSTVASTGTKGMDFSFTLEDGRKAIIYGVWYEKPDGTKLFNYDIINSLLGIVGAKSLTPYDKTIEVKDGKKIVQAFKELDGKKIQVALQVEKDIYNGEERDRLGIYGFFAESGHSYSELAVGSEAKKIEYVKKNLKDRYSKEWKKFNAEIESFSEDDDSESLL